MYKVFPSSGEEVRVWIARVAGHGVFSGGDGDWWSVEARQGSRMRGGKGGDSSDLLRSTGG